MSGWILIFMQILLVVIVIGLMVYIYKLKREVRRLSKGIREGEYIHSIDMFDKDIENLASSVNKRIRLEEKKEQKLKEQDKSFKQMVVNLSHDLRTPLTIIIGYLQLVKLEKNINEPIQKYIECIEKKSIYLQKLIDDVYTLFWSEAIDEEIKMCKIDLTSVVSVILKEYIQNSRVAAEQMDIIIPQEPVWIMGEEKILSRIFCNMLDNALKYSTGEIVFQMYVKEKSCIITISNPSHYISNDELKSIFELFYTKDKARISSSGIGLYNTKKLLEQIRGKVDAQYKKGIFQIIVEIPLYNS